MTEPSPRTPRPASEETPYVDDPVSRVWVAVIAAVFGLIFLFVLLFGHAGFFSSVPTEPPSPSPSPVPTVAPSQSVAPSFSPSPSLSPSPSPSPSPSVSPSPVPTVSLSASPS